jgi:CIC family chloride channel protein
MRVLVACGAAGGIAATFNAPLAGVFFAMELILRDFAAQSFGMVVLSSVTASVIGRAVFGNQPFLHLPAFTIQHPVEYALFAALGLVAGVVGVLFTRVLYLMEDGCDAAWARVRGPEWARPAVGGLLLGVLLLLLPEMYGVGYPVLGKGVAGGYTIAFLLALLAGKIVATSLTIGIGGSGGVFAPSLFIGAMAGAAYGQALHHVIPGLSGQPGAYALIGMGAVFAGAARAPITAVIIMFELTGDYAIILPLMAAIVLAAGVSHLLSADTIYTLKLRRRGIDIDHEPSASALAAATVEQVMGPVAATAAVPVHASLREAADALSRSRYGQLPVLDGAGAFQGVVTARSVADTLAGPGHETDNLASVVEYPPTVTIEQSLEHTLDALATADGPLPVLDTEHARLVGWLTHQQVLRALRSQPTPSESRTTAAVEAGADPRRSAPVTAVVPPPSPHGGS